MKNELRLGSYGVCLSDYDESGHIYFLNCFLGDKIQITSIIDSSKIKIIPQSDFWALI